MKRFYMGISNTIVAAFLLAFAANTTTAQAASTTYSVQSTVTLDLNNPTNPTSWEYDDNNVWVEAFTEIDYTYWTSQGMKFSHLIGGEGSSYGGSSWNGFIASKNTSNTNQDNWYSNQWGCMAGGGIASIEDGEVTVSADQPYVYAYWDSWSNPSTSLSVIYEGDKTFTPQSVYIANSPWGYYGCLTGDGYATAFTTEGDEYAIIIHGVAASGEESTIKHILAQYTGGELVASSDWEFVDLTSLGEVASIYFTMESSDSSYGWMNTATYFCLDQLSVTVESEVVVTDGVLNMNFPTNPESWEFDSNSVWTETFTEIEYTYWTSQKFNFSHLIGGEGSSYGGSSWNGFTASKNTSNTNQEDWYSNQWGCMAGGGIASVDNGEVTVSADQPYVYAYWDSWSNPTTSLSITYGDNEAFAPQSVYIANSPWGYYGCLTGDGYATAFANVDDEYEVIIHGVDANGDETTISHTLALYTEEGLEISDKWELVDLTLLGEVVSIYFTMESTDSSYGWMNTATYFCLDRLVANEVTPSSVKVVEDDNTKVYYSKTTASINIEASANSTAYVYNTAGVLVAQQGVVAGVNSINLNGMANGVYIVKVANKTYKVIKG